jgi:hypothetical protein
MSLDSSQSGSTLTVTGTNDQEDVTITGTGAGAVTVTNDRNGNFESFTGVSTLVVDLRSSGDRLEIIGVDLDGGFVNVRMGADNDILTLGGTLDADVRLDGEAGEDDIDLSGGVTVLGDLAWRSSAASTTISST